MPIDNNPELEKPKLTLTKENLPNVESSFPEFFLSFIQGIGSQLEAFMKGEFAEKSNDLILDCQTFKEHLQNNS